MQLDRLWSHDSHCTRRMVACLGRHFHNGHCSVFRIFRGWRRGSIGVRAFLSHESGMRSAPDNLNYSPAAHEGKSNDLIKGSSFLVESNFIQQCPETRNEQLCGEGTAMISRGVKTNQKTALLHTPEITQYKIFHGRNILLHPSVPVFE